MFLIGGWPGVFWKLFGKNIHGPPISWNGLMHDPSQTPTQKHLTLPPSIQQFTVSNIHQNVTGSENN